MPPSPSHPAFVRFRADLANLSALNVRHETGIRAPFQNLLSTLAQESGLTLVAEQTIEGTRIRPDGTLRDVYNLPRGYWESKDTDDDLENEINKKKRKGYPFTNIVFEDTQKAVLYQNSRRIYDADLTDASQTAALLTAFLTYQEPDPTSFDNAMNRFGEVIPALAAGLIDRINKERAESVRFATAFDSLYELCVKTLNPHIAPAVVVEMLAQHLLTERLFRTIFDNADFVRRNIIAQKVEETISVMVSRSFNRGDFTQALDKYYYPIESRARESSGWEQKQTFLNTLYERFFQDFSKKAADTQGIVYTPQPIVNFMVESVDALLQSEFNTSLSQKGVVVLDPCVGTGNFMQNLLRRISPLTLEHKYKHELFCNENMLLPYYIASLNIEHAFYEKAGYYEAFPGLCFADTLMLDNAFASGTGRLDYFSEENAERVQAEQDAPVTVIIGNPPYNVGQMNENENNKNRVHSTVARRLRDTYVKDSKATNKNALWDMYVRFFRWATDRLGERDGIVAFVTNNGFLTDTAFDGMRKHLADDFTSVYHLNLGGNVRKNPHLSGTTHNVFQIQVGVGITFLVRRTGQTPTIFYAALDNDIRRGERLEQLAKWGDVAGVPWEEVTPGKGNHWLNEGIQADFEGFLPLVSRTSENPLRIFGLFSNGLKTNRDDVVYNFDKTQLEKCVRQLIKDYNAEVMRWQAEPLSPIDRTSATVDSFVSYSKVKWSEALKANLRRGKEAIFDENKVRQAMYRPFCSQFLYFDAILNERRYNQPAIFPTIEAEKENKAIWIKQGNTEVPWVLAVQYIPDVMPNGGSQCFPFYTYDKDGTDRRENITDTSINTANKHYAKKPDNTPEPVSKWDIFHYIYALLHHPDYRTRYRENLKRELPRIPFVPLRTTFNQLAFP